MPAPSLDILRNRRGSRGLAPGAWRVQRGARIGPSLAGLGAEPHTNSSSPARFARPKVLRRLGLTGTKIGCGAGQCGACSVLLNGEVVRSCVKKIRAIEDYSRVDTIEGLGTANHLHPLQMAWMVHGAVQCGFCVPGFIMSAKGLLDRNSSPTRPEVRAWFQQHRNACRCTGYKQIVDAVMAAAQVMRGEMTMEELAWQMPAGGRIYGTSIPRPAALAKVLGTCDYGDDIGRKMPHVLHLAVVMPGCSHANVRGIDFSEAEKAPGVFKIITAADVLGDNRIALPTAHPRALADGLEQPIISDKKVLRYGDVLALVAADTPAQARAAAKLVKLDLEPLPEYPTALEAAAEDAREIHPSIPNLWVTLPVFKGRDTREVIDDSDFMVEGSFYSTRQPHLVIEPDTGQAYLEDDGTLTIHCKALALSVTKDAIAGGIGHPADQIRVILNPTGASFGYTMSPETPALLAVAALATKRPVSLTLSYPEHQHFTGKRAASFSNGRLSCDREGKLTGVEFELVFDKGCYTEYGAALAEVEVDVDTGKTRVVAMHCVGDVGVIGNRAVVDGQAYGGMMHTIGFALSENYCDVKKHATLAGAGFPYIETIPDGDDFTVDYVETLRPAGPNGSSGCSELFQTSGHVAILNAIYDAVGVRIFDLPATPAKVKALMDAKAAGREVKPEPYFFGEDFYDTVDDIKANPLVEG